MADARTQRDLHKTGHQHVTFRDAESLQRYVADLATLHPTDLAHVDADTHTVYFLAGNGGHPPSKPVRDASLQYDGAWGDDPPRTLEP